MCTKSASPSETCNVSVLSNKLDKLYISYLLIFDDIFINLLFSTTVSKQMTYEFNI